MVLFEIVWVAREIYAASLRHGGWTSLPGLHYNSSHPVGAGLRAGPNTSIDHLSNHRFESPNFLFLRRFR